MINLKTIIDIPRLKKQNFHVLEHILESRNELILYLINTSMNYILNYHN